MVENSSSIDSDLKPEIEKVEIYKEFIAGLTTFFTIAYIVVVNPAILSTKGTGLPYAGVLTATVLLCFSMTLFMGLYARLPFAVAPGMGINAFFTYTVILGKQVPWETALAMVFWSGVLFVLISVTPIREEIAKSIPLEIRVGVAAGIGIFLALIGLQNAGIIVAHPITLVTFGKINYKCIFMLIGACVMLWLYERKNPLAFLSGIFLITIMAFFSGDVKLPESFFSKPDFSLFGRLDFVGALKLSLVPTIISLFFTDFFDSISTFIGVSHACGMLDEKGQPKNLKEGLIVDAFATLTGGIFGTSSGTAYIESASGIEVGGQTGLTSVFTALCFLPCLFLAPLAMMVPAFATAPVLVIVGALMFKSIATLNLNKIEDLVPVYLTMILIPLTFSITLGILWGFISHVFLYVMVGRRKDVAAMMYIIAALSIGLLLLEHGKF
ncbi:NCS2 family permease [Candidatus Riflebacteria bacterium]